MIHDEFDRLLTLCISLLGLLLRGDFFLNLPLLLDTVIEPLRDCRHEGFH